jgi:hypothetical protein
MRTTTKIFGLGAACAACCAGPFAVTALSSASLLALGSDAWPLAFGAAAAAVPVIALASLSRRRAAQGAPDSAVPKACGCGDACATGGVPIACTLGTDDFKERASWIRDLARRSLRKAQGGPLMLDLTYAPDAAADVRELVAKERACCSFLDFDLRQDAAGVYLLITAPPEAADVADLLFAHFAPDLASLQEKEPA